MEALPQLSHRAEIQDLRLFEASGSSGGGGEAGGACPAVLAGSDCYGRAVLAHCRRASPGGELQVTEVVTLQPDNLLR